MVGWICVWFAHEPLALLDGLEEEALAALPGGTGPGALTGANDTTGASRERRLQGPRHHDGDRGFFVSPEPGGSC